MVDRVNKLRSKMNENAIDNILVFKPQNRKYLSNFTGSTGFVLITKESNYFATDFRYIEQAKVQCKGFEIVELNNEFTIFSLLNKLNITKLGIEETYITYNFVNQLKDEVEDINLIKSDKLVNDLRLIKDLEEINLIEKAAEITDKAYEHILKIIKPGMIERDIAIELEYFMRKNGAEGPSFSFIVASGERSALPHGVASSKVINNGDIVTIDMGCIYKGYCSDMTRTFVLGKANDKQKEIYNIVLKAQKTALQAIKPGITGYEVDKIARDIIESYGYGKYFGHGLGHGVGLEVHEQPRLAKHDSAKKMLRSGMVVTDEPGIYIPDFGGVRIEDLIAITDDGYKVLSKSNKELIEI